MDEFAYDAIEEAGNAFFLALGIADPAVSLERPKNNTHGDIAMSAPLKYAKELGKNPLELAQALASELLQKDIEIVDSVEASAPGFVNISLSPIFFARFAKQVLEAGDLWGVNDRRKGEKWAIEHTSPNPNKAMHLGHLHNNLVGMVLSNIIEHEGAEVVRDCVDNNRGIAIARAMWGYLSLMRKNDSTPVDLSHWFSHRDEWFTPEEKAMTPDRFITECYVFGSEAAKKDEAVDEAIRQMVIDWEKEDDPTWRLWEQVLAYSYQGMQRTLTRLGNQWDVVWHEHEHYKDGKKWVLKGLELGVFKKLEDGAVLSDLASYDLPDTILLKNDGTSLYLTQDIALTAMKKETYKADKLVWVVGPEQSLQLKQLFAICEQLGIGRREDFLHVPFGYVGLAENGAFKKMSSREGTVVLIDDVIDAVKEKVSDQREDKNDAIAEALAVGAVKFSILKSNKDQQIAFDVDRSVEVQGDSGVYVLYTYARMRSVMRKAAEKSVVGAIQEGEESGISVLRLLPHYWNALARADQDFSAHHLAQFALDLSGAFNQWYNNEQILDGSGLEAHKVAIVDAASLALKATLSILGIHTLESI